MRQRDTRKGVVIPWGGGGRLVGGLRTEPYEERKVCSEERWICSGRAPDVIGGLIRKNVLEVVAIALVPNDVSVLVEVVAQEVSRRPVPFLPPGRHVLSVIAVEILPKQSRLVAVFL